MEKTKDVKASTTVKKRHNKSNSNVDDFAFVNNEKIFNTNVPNYINNLDGMIGYKNYIIINL